MAKVTKTFQYGSHQVTLETGEIARQAGGAVMVSCDGTVLLVTAVAAKTAREGQDFFPLTVDYQEKFYAGGRIPGGFFKREGRQTEKETLISRLIDRPIRPLFPEDFKNEVQIIATVMSMNPEIDGDILALIGASAALSLSGTPFHGPIGAAKVGYKDGQYLLNPTATELKDSELELVVAGTANAVLMVESEAEELSEDVMLGAVMFGHREMQKVDQRDQRAGRRSRHQAVVDWQPPAKNDAHDRRARRTPSATASPQAFQVARQAAAPRRDLGAARRTCMAVAAGRRPKPDGWNAADLAKEFGELEYQTMRDVGARAPRSASTAATLDTVRPISVAASACCRASHGSALFTRGETQAIVAVTLGTARDGQIIDAVCRRVQGTLPVPLQLPAVLGR